MTVKRMLPYVPFLANQTHWLAFQAGVHAVTAAADQMIDAEFTKWVFTARREIAEGTLPHQYVSSACQHLLHDDCHDKCKYCEMLCCCRCHDGA